MRVNLFLISILISGLSFFFDLPILAQSGRGLPIGSWRTHLPFNDVKAVEKFNNLIYAATSSGVFSVDPTSGEMSILSKVQGLSDVGVSIMRKHPARELLFIGYENGNIDLIENGKIINLPDLKISSVTGSKQINGIDFYENEAYLACDFGLVILNLDKKEVKESNLTMGSGGQATRVREVTRFRDSLFCITDAGFKSILRSQNIQNTNLWYTYTGLVDGDPFFYNPRSLWRVNRFCESVVLGTQIHFFRLGKPKEHAQILTFSGDVRSMRRTGCEILATTVAVLSSGDQIPAILLLDSAGNIKDTIRGGLISQPFDAIKTGDHEYWIADIESGLIRVKGKDQEAFKPNGPVSLSCVKLYNYEDKVVFLSGGYSYPVGYYQFEQKAGFSIFHENQWQNYNNKVNPNVPPVRDLVSARYNFLEKKLYLCSYGFGVMTMKDGVFEVMNDTTTNAGLCNILPDYANDCRFNYDDPLDRPYKPFVRTTSCVFDAYNNLLVANFGGPAKSIRIRLADTQQWTTAAELRYANANCPLDILNDKSNQKWIRMAPNRSSNDAAIWVMDETGGKIKELNASPTQGGLPSTDVYDIAEDKQGLMWVGTSKGLAVFYNPSAALSEGGITASTPIYPPEAGRPVLENDIVTSIEVDGGNRKWVGTKDNGLWLFNSDITKVIHHFTTANSPLFSDQIIDLEINKATGELFISTDKGVLSYQTDATENPDPTSCEGSDVSIFPNPVEKGYSGLIAVKGLASNSTVKFVTASGKMVYQTTSEGGMATWNGITYDGKKAHPGIYIVLSATADGKANCISKLAILE